MYAWTLGNVFIHRNVFLFPIAWNFPQGWFHSSWFGAEIVSDKVLPPNVESHVGILEKGCCPWDAETYRAVNQLEHEISRSPRGI